MRSIYNRWSVTNAHAAVLRAASVLALFKPSGAPGLELAERPEPEAGDHEVKIRVMRTGICGTDLHIESWDAWAASTVTAPAAGRCASAR